MGNRNELLPYIIKPGRYTNGELGSVKKEGEKIGVALVYPDLYEFAISSFEHRQVYAILNQSFSIAVERAYLPAPDAQKVMLEKDIPLFTVESGRSVSEFDLILFQTERKRDHFFFPRLAQLAGLSPEREKRRNAPPAVTFGRGSLWPGGLGRFFDAALHLEGFDASLSLAKNLIDLGGRFDRQRFFENLEGGTVFAAGKTKKGFPQISSAEYEDYFPKLLVSSLDAENPLQTIRLDGLTGALDMEAAAGRLVKEVAATGYNEVRLEFAGGEPPAPLEALVAPLAAHLSTVHGKIDFSNLKPELFSHRLPLVLKKTSVVGLGFYLGSGVDRHRKLLGIEAEKKEIFERLREALSISPRQFRLYLYLGFPNETDEEIIETAKFLNDLAFEVRRGSQRTYLRGYVGTFHGVTHQGLWPGPLIGPAEVLRRQEILKKNLSARNLQLRYEPPEQILLNGLWERAGEKVADVISGYASHIGPEEIPDHGANYQRLAYVLQEAGIDAEVLLASEFPNAEDWAYRPVIVKKVSAAAAAVPVPSAPAVPAAAEGGIQYGRSKRKISFKPEALQVPNTAVRFRWEKGEEARFSAHLDVIKVFERALRRAGLPVSHSQGQQPHPKIAFGPPLPLGHLSTAEYLDVRFDKPYTREFFQKFAEGLPPGFRLLDARPILAKTESLSAAVNVARYEVKLPSEISAARCREMLDRKEIWAERTSGGERKQVNVRPFVRELGAYGSGLQMELVMSGSDYARPEEVISFGLGLPEMIAMEAVFIRRELLIFSDGKLLSPFEVT
jgi:radical SAM-linked protein